MASKENGDGTVVLSSQEAIDLWLQGKKAWNDWANQHPKANVSFYKVDFNKEAEDHGMAEISFSGYRFPDGGIDFRRTSFGDYNVSFTLAHFGNGNVDFSSADFGSGDCDFTSSTFGKGTKDFSFVNFKDGNVDFFGVQFGQGNIVFSDANFADCLVMFTKAEFGTGDVDFHSAKFRTRNVDFHQVRFGDGNVVFDDARFDGGDVIFSSALFGEGNVSFKRATFNNRNVNFYNAEFNSRQINFAFMQFGAGDFTFLPKPLTQCKLLSFSSASFEGTLSIAGLKCPVPINLSHTVLKHPLELHNVQLGFQRAPKYKLLERAVLSEDSARFRRLKILAKDGGDHERALEFFAQEMRADYWHGIKGLKLLFFYLYDCLSNYGRSVARPGLALALSAFGFAKLYQHLATESHTFSDAIVFSISQALPFYFGARDAKDSSIDRLFLENTDQLPNLLHAFTLSQGIISGIFIFLIALALRNIFRS